MPYKVSTVLGCVTAGLPSYKPNRRVYASRNAGVLSNEVVTSGNSKEQALWVIKLYCKLVSLKDYLRKGNKCNYILRRPLFLTLKYISPVGFLDCIGFNRPFGSVDYIGSSCSFWIPGFQRIHLWRNLYGCLNVTSLYSETSFLLE